MSFTVKESKLTQKLKKLDNTTPLSEEPLPKRNGLIWILCGRKGSSKTTVLMNSLKTKQSHGGYKGFFHNIFICSPSMERDKKTNKLVEEVKKDGNFYDTINNDILNEIIEKVKDFNDNYEEEEEGDQCYNLLVLDDCLSLLPKSNQKNAVFNSLCLNCRHLKLSIFITAQKLKGLSTVVRSNTDMISMFRTDNETEKKDFLSEFACPEPIYDFATAEPYSFCHITFTSGKPIYFKKFDRIEL